MPKKKKLGQFEDPSAIERIDEPEGSEDIEDEPEAPREEAETPGHTAHVSLRVRNALRSLRLRRTALGMAWQRICAEEDAGPKTKP